MPTPVDAHLLEDALLLLGNIVPCDWAVLYVLSGDRLEVEAAVVPSGTAQPHGQPLARWSAARRALQGRRPARLAELGGREGDAPPRGLDLPDGSACAMIPLFQAEDDLGLVAIARRSGEAYTDEALDLAGIYGRLLSSTVARVGRAGRRRGVDEADAPLLPLREAERRHLVEALRQTSGKIYGPDGAARLLDLRPTTLQSKLKKHGIDRLQAAGVVSEGGASQGLDRAAPVEVREGSPAASASSTPRTSAPSAVPAAQ